MYFEKKIKTHALNAIKCEFQTTKILTALFNNKIEYYVDSYAVSLSGNTKLFLPLTG